MPGNNVILRRYLRQRLAEYYSQPADKVVGGIDPGPASKGIDFRSLINEWHWKYTYKTAYKEQRGRWLTPVELFFPYYSNTLANFVSGTMAASLKNSSRCGNDGGAFEIIELGGGRGTNANALLNHLRECHSGMYRRLRRYAIFDSSPSLLELQRKVLIDGSRHADKIELINVDMTDVAEGNSKFLAPSDMPTALIGLELLDNLPHDKIGRCMQTGDILQAEVEPVDSKECDPIGQEKEWLDHSLNYLDTSQEYIETFSPMNDPLLQRIISLAPSLYTAITAQGPRWVPTVALGILMKLLQSRPNSSIAFADFDWLPPPDLGDMSATRNPGGLNLPLAEPAIGDPIVTDMQGNDHSCYLTSPPNALCDILFSTDFGRLAAFTKLINVSNAKSKGGAKRAPVTAQAMKQSEFLMKYGPEEVNNTRGWTGYSPLIHDFGNCSVLTVTTGPR